MADLADISEETRQSDENDGSTPFVSDGLSAGMELAIERMETAIERASAMIPQVEEICARAEQVHDSLSDFAGHLADVGEKSQSRVSTLLDTVGSAARAKKDMDQAHDRCADLLSRLERTSTEQNARMTRVSDERLRVIEEAASNAERRIVELQRAEQTRMECAAEEVERRVRRTTEDYAVRLRDDLDSRLEKVKKREADLLAAASKYDIAATGSVAQIEQQANEAVDGIQSLMTGGSERIESQFSAALEHIKSHATEVVEHLESAAFEKFEKRLQQLGEQGVKAVCDSNTEQLAELRSCAKTETSRFRELIDSKAKQLASQLQAASVAERQTSDATKEAHDVIGKVTAAREAMHGDLATMEERCESTSRLVVELREIDEAVQPTARKISECIEGSDATIQRIERLIQDVWTLTTTTQHRFNQLTKRCNDATTTINRLESSQDRAKDLDSSIAEQAIVAKRNSDELGVILEKATGTRAQVEAVCQRAAESVVAVETAKSAGGAACESLMSATANGERAGDVLQRLLSTAAHTREDILERQSETEVLIQRVERGNEAQDALVRELRGHLDGAGEILKGIETSVAGATGLREAIDSSTAKADEVNRETTTMISALIERRGLIEECDHVMKDFIPQVEQIRTQLQQLQTRTDSFDHQLGGMLADPRKIIEEARAQATHLDGVCRAVRKVFSGLSQASLQANRDITRFSKSSREADVRLTQLTVETQRAGQTLREWVDEASHVQSRLSKTLAMVPPLGQTHPPSNLDNLADATTVLPMDPSAPIRRSRIADKGHDRGGTRRVGRVGEQLDPGTNFADLIKQAEELTVGKS